MDNVILTPHIGGSTLEAQDNIGIEVASKLVRYSDNGSTLSAVNFPEVTLPEHPHSRRLLHIHRNVPGTLSRINELFSAGNINIDAQFLQTDSEVGYVVIDVSADEAQANALKNEDGSNSRYLAQSRAVLKKEGRGKGRNPRHYLRFSRFPVSAPCVRHEKSAHRALFSCSYRIGRGGRI